MEMTSLDRMLAAIRGEPFDTYPFVIPSAPWSMMPHWPELLGLNFLHRTHGTDAEKMRFYEALHEIVGLDWMDVGQGSAFNDRGRYRVATEDGDPVLVDTSERTRTRYRELPMDRVLGEPLFDTARDVERLPPVPTAEELLASGAYDFARQVVDRFGHAVFLYTVGVAPFPHAYYMLGHEKLFDAMRSQPDLLFALMERQSEILRQQARLARMLGLHGMDVMEFFCSADLISERDYLRFAFPYEQRGVCAIREEGLIASMNLMGWIEPRLPLLARLELNCLHVECGLKGYRNDLSECRRVLGEEVCLFGNAHAVRVIEQGDEATWRQDALEQAQAVGKERRYAIGAGLPVTWETSPARLRRYAEFTRNVLAEVVPPPG